MVLSSWILHGCAESKCLQLVAIARTFTAKQLPPIDLLVASPLLQASSDCSVVVHHEDEEPLSGLDAVTGYKLDWLKVGLAVFFWLEEILGTFIPLFFMHHKAFYTVLSLINCFSAGVFLAAGMLHLLPHALEAEEVLGLEEAVAPTMLVVGYLLIFAVERLPFESHSHGTGALHHDPTPPTHCHSHASSDGHVHSHPAPVPEELVSSTTPISPRDTIPSEAAGQTKTKIQGLALAHGHITFYSLLVFLCSIGVHQVLESVVVGVADTARSALLLSAAIAIHKLPTHVALSTRYLRAGYTVRKLLWWLLPFSLVCPLSVLLGLAVSRAAEVWVELVFMGLTAGVFVYIGATEVVCEEFEHVNVPEGMSVVFYKLRKFIAVVLGFLVIFPAIFIPHEH